MARNPLSLLLAVAVLLLTLSGVARAQDPPLEQAKEEAGTLPAPVAEIDTPVGRLGFDSAELLATRFGQDIRLTLELDRAVERGTMLIAIPKRWRERSVSGLRPSRPPRQAGRARGARVGAAHEAVELILDGAAAGTEVTAAIRDTGIAPGTYSFPVAYAEGGGKPKKLGRLEIRLYAPVRERDEVPWSALERVNVSNSPGEQSETFITAVPGNANRLIAGANGGVGGYSAWISDNGGQTWVERVVPTTADTAGSASDITLNPCCDPMSAADAAGNMWYGGLDFTPDSRIHVTRVPAGSTNFVAKTVALKARTTGTQDKPMMTIDNSSSSPTFGRLYVVWNEPASGGINIVSSHCDTRPGGTLDAARCDNADNWTTPVSVTKATSGYIYADVAVGPDGKAYVTWWNYTSANAIQGATCQGSATTCDDPADWSAPSSIATLDQTGGAPIPFECPIVAQPGGRASTGPNVEVDISGTATNGRVWVAWSDLRPGSGTTRCSDGVAPATTHLSFDSFAATAVNQLPGSAAPSADVATRLATDGTGGGQPSSDDWFPWVTVDQTTGQAYADFYSTRHDGARKAVHFYARSIAPSGELGALTQVSTVPSDYSTQPCCDFGNQYGDYTGIDATSGFVFPIWSDKSAGSNGEALMVKTQLPTPGPAPVLNPGDATVSDPAPSGDGDGVAEPGETLSISIPVSNVGTAAANATVGTLTSSDPKVTFPDGSASYGSIASGATAQPDSAYRVHLDETLPCGATIPLDLGLTYTGGSATRAYTVPTGTVQSTASTDVPKSIPDGSGSASSTLTMPASGTIGDVNVGVDITHTWVGDLVVVLRHPDGTEITLTSQTGNGNNSGDNLTGTVFDDEAANPFAGSSAPFTGSFRPDEALSALDGKPWAGTWTLIVSDVVMQDVGTLTGWSLKTATCSAAPANQAPTASLSAPASAGVGQTVTLDASGSSDSDGSIVKYEFDKDANGSFETDNGADPTVDTSFASVGDKTVGVRVTDADGATDTATAVVSVTAAPANQAPTAALSGPVSARVGELVTWSGAGSSDPDGTINVYEWDLDGDGSFETMTGASSVQASYPAAGTFVVKLRVTDDDGATSAVVEKTITVTADSGGPTPSPTASPTPTATPDPGPGPQVDPVVALAGSKTLKARKGRFAVQLAGCAQCTGTLVLKTTKKVKVGRRRKIVRIANVRFDLGSTGASKVRVRLSRSNQRLLRRYRRLRLKATMTVVNGAGAKATTTGRLTIKR